MSKGAKITQIDHAYGVYEDLMSVLQASGQTMVTVAEILSEALDEDDEAQLREWIHWLSECGESVTSIAREGRVGVATKLILMQAPGGRRGVE